MKNSSPIVSMIIPVHNSEEYLNDCLDSVKNQTFDNFECILVVNASKDSSIDICNEYSKNDERFVVINTEIPGVSHARNLGLENVNSDYVCFVDSDDIIEPSYIESMLSYAKNGEYGMILCKKILQKKFKPFKLKKKYREMVDNAVDCTNKMICSNPYNGTATDKLFKRELIGNIRFNETISFAEDLLFCYEYLKNCNKVIYFNKPLYHYMFHKNSLSNGKFNTKQLTCLDVMDIISNDTKDKSIKDNAICWKGFLAIMLAYYCKRDKYKNKEIIQNLKECIKTALPYAKKSKHLKWYYRVGIKPLYLIIKAIM